MKNFLTIIFIAFVTLNYGQHSCGDGYGERGGAQIFDYNNFFHAASTRNAGVILAKTKLESVEYETANIILQNGESKTYLARFNPYLNEVELKVSENQIVYLKKIEGLKIRFNKSNTTYSTLSYFNDNGELNTDIFINQNNSNLFKKLDSKYVAAKKAVKGYDSNTPAKYRVREFFYYKNYRNQLVKLEKRKRNLVKTFSDFSDEIEAFIKTNRIDLRDSDSLAKLTDYIHLLESDKFIDYDLVILDKKK